MKKKVNPEKTKTIFEALADELHTAQCLLESKLNKILGNGHDFEVELKLLKDVHDKIIGGLRS